MADLAFFLAFVGLVLDLSFTPMFASWRDTPNE